MTMLKRSINSLAVYINGVATPTPSRCSNGHWRSERKRSDPITLTSLNCVQNLALSLCSRKDRYADAEPLFKRSLAIREKARGFDQLM